MAKMKRNKVLYLLTVEDFQTVAMDEYDRELTTEQLEKVAAWVEDRIPWYDLICDGIQEVLEIS